MIQQVLSCCESLSTDLSVFLDTSEDDYYVYLGVALLERVSADPANLGRKMLIGRLYNGGVRLRSLHDKFGHDGRTAKKWGNALKSCDANEMAVAFSGRQASKKSTPALIAYVQQQYRHRASLGKAYREKIILGVEEVFGVRISRSLTSLLFKSAEKATKDAPVFDEIKATSGQLALDSASKESSSVQQSPVFSEFARQSDLCRDSLIRHAGLVLFGNALVHYDSFQRQIICQLLQGACNIEQSKSLCFDSLKFFNDELLCSLREQREMLDALATKENTIALYRRNNELLSDGPNLADIFYFDPHTKNYTGQLKLMKGWCGSSHSIGKIINLDSFHTISGRACFIQHYSPYYDMRERFFMSRKLFNELFDEDKRSGRTFIIDRGIYGLECFARFENDCLITWEKGFDGTGWDDNLTSIAFARTKQKNSRSGKRKYSFECQESIWKRNGSFRRILVKATNHKKQTITVSILCSNPEMSVQDIVWHIFNRWLQENDFKYLNVNFGVNQLDSRAHTDFKKTADEFQDRNEATTEYKNAKKLTKTATAALAKHLLTINKKNTELKNARLEQAKIDYSLTQDDENIKPQLYEKQKSINALINRLNKTIAELEENQLKLEQNMDAAERQQMETISQDSRIKRLIEENYQLLDLKRKAYMDALRINAANIFRNLHDEYRIIRNNYRDDHYYLRMLSRCSGFIERSKEVVKVKLWLPGTIQKHIVKSLETLAKIAEENINRLSKEKVKIELLTGTITTK